MNKRIAILATDGFEESELQSPKDAIEKQGWQAEIVSLKSGTIKAWSKGDCGQEYPVDNIVDDVKELCPRMAIINKGKVLVQGNPLQIMENLQGRLYEKTIHKNELEQYKKEYQVISDRLYLGNQIVHVLSDTHPGSSFKLIDANLEDVYMSQIFNA